MGQRQTIHAPRPMAESLAAHVCRDGCQAAGFEMMHRCVHQFPAAWDILQGLGAKPVTNRRRNTVDRHLFVLLATHSTV